jgi:hypothetical protein
VTGTDLELEEAIWRLNSTDDDGLPVLDGASGHVVGWLTHRGILNAYRGRLAGGNEGPR